MIGQIKNAHASIVESDVVNFCFVVLARLCFVYDERAMSGCVCSNDWVFCRP